MPSFTQPRYALRNAEPKSRELGRAPSVSARSDTRSGGKGYGIERMEAGTRVMHATFGVGVIRSMRDMGGDVLYEVEFDSVGTKKLMATFAKLERIK
jgi:DNA helicase-2/ATP-dependent DNA helicase PcrA